MMYVYYMMLYVYMGLCFVPVIALFSIFCIFVPGFKIRHGLISTLLGLFALLPITVVQYFILNLPIFSGNTLLSVLVTALIFNGLIEESTKMTCMLFLPKKNISFQTFFAMSILAGLSLGAFETLIYLFSGFHNVGIRTITALLVHTFCAGLSGIFLWTLRNKPTNTYIFVVAVVLHGIYNFFAGFSGGFKWFSVIAIFLAAIECRIWYVKIAHPE